MDDDTDMDIVATNYSGFCDGRRYKCLYIDTINDIETRKTPNHFGNEVMHAFFKIYRFPPRDKLHPSLNLVFLIHPFS